jgi:hypothetical protein
MSYESRVTMKGLDHWRHEIRDGSFHVIQVVSGDRGWTKYRGVTRRMMGDELAAHKQGIYLEAIPVTLLPIKAEGFKYRASNDAKVGGRPASVLTVTGPDGREFMLYFDNGSGLPVKEVAKMSDMRGQPFVRETTFSDYKEFDGIKKATTVEVKIDDRIEHVLEVTEFKVLDRVAPETFLEQK